MVFDRHYASCYDLFYSEKDYPAECDMLESLFAARGLKPRTIVDLGCGTARHSVLLAQRGYTMYGVDRSEEMLQLAADRVANAGCEVSLHHQEIQSLELGRRFDAAVAMFAVIGYLSTNDLLVNALKRIFAHVEPGGLFVFDCWYGPAVVTHGPQQRFQRFNGPGGEEIVRLVTPHTEGVRQTVDVEYETLVLSDGRIESRSNEKHRMRFFHPMEIQLALETVGFRDVRIGVFARPDQTPTEDDWNVVVSAQRPLDEDGDTGFSTAGSATREVDSKQ